MTYYERMSALDASFLGLEDGNCHMHVGAVMLFEAAPLRSADGSIDIERIRRAVQARLHLVPRFRQRVLFVPYERMPVWADEDRFHLDYHVRHTALPHPGNERELKRLVGRIMSQPLDRKRPLWEIWVVEGLQDDRVALLSKTHHCMVDGISGADLMSVILSPFPDSEPGTPQPWKPRPRPGNAQLVLDAVSRRVAQPLEAARVMYEMLSDEHKIGELVDSVEAVIQTLTPALSPVSRTPINVEIGPYRRFDWTQMRVGDLKAVKNALGGTLNDVVLAVVAAGLRSFFAQRGVAPDELEIRAMVPVSVRTEEQRGTLGNRVSQMAVPLPVHIADALERLQAVRRTTHDVKDSKQALGAQVLTTISEWAVPTLLVQAVRLANRARPYNLIVTNVPGPQIPLYLLGAEMKTAYPVVPLFENMALVVGLFSYNGGLFWGINSDWEQLPDLHDFVLALEAGFKEIEEMARVAASALASKRAKRSHRRNLGATGAVTASDL